jgi:hypothetical protein
MLIVLAVTSIALYQPHIPRDVLVSTDTVVQGRQDTVRDDRPVTILKNGVGRGIPGFRTFAPSLFDIGQSPYRLSSSALDSLLRSEPFLRGPLLEDLLIPGNGSLDDASHITSRTFNEQLIKDSRFTPFERMSLIAKRQAELYRNDNSIRWYQLNIIGTILWLEGVFK